MASTEQILAVAGLWIAALILLVQQCGFPIPIPTFFILFAVGFATARGFYSLTLAFALMLVPLVIGGIAHYILARRAADSSSPAPGRLHLSPQQLDAARTRIERWGWLAVLVGTALPGMRAPMMWSAGQSGMPRVRYILALTLGCAIYAAWHFVLAFAAVGLVVELQTWTRTQIFMLALAIGIMVTLVRWQFGLLYPTESVSRLRNLLDGSSPEQR